MSNPRLRGAPRRRILLVLIGACLGLLLASGPLRPGIGLDSAAPLLALVGLGSPASAVGTCPGDLVEQVVNEAPATIAAPLCNIACGPLANIFSAPVSAGSGIPAIGKLDYFDQWHGACQIYRQDPTGKSFSNGECYLNTTCGPNGTRFADGGVWKCRYPAVRQTLCVPPAPPLTITSFKAVYTPNCGLWDAIVAGCRGSYRGICGQIGSGIAVPKYEDTVRGEELTTLVQFKGKNIHLATIIEVSPADVTVSFPPIDRSPPPDLAPAGTREIRITTLPQTRWGDSGAHTLTIKTPDGRSSASARFTVVSAGHLMVENKRGNMVSACPMPAQGRSGGLHTTCTVGPGLAPCP